ncbi:MAG: hypothetical protein JWM11_7170 [Planctomycetaceae bacterium]|nr:hypothetical protein [Planctomycetaceae bacterium]
MRGCSTTGLCAGWRERLQTPGGHVQIKGDVMTEAMWQFLEFSNIANLVSSLIWWMCTAIAGVYFMPKLKRFLREQREQHAIIHKTLYGKVSVVLYGVFDSQIRSEELGVFPTTYLGHRLASHVMQWNEKPSGDIIVPESKLEAERMEFVLTGLGSGYLQASHHIDVYFENIVFLGTPNYQYAEMVIALARPDAHKLESLDHPRLLIVEQSALKRIGTENNIAPEIESREARTWHATLQQMAKMYEAGELPTYSIPMHPSKYQNREIKAPASS